MNRIFLIGNLCRDPELRSTPAGIPVCSFTLAVNRRKAGSEAVQPEADFFRVTAWRQLGENCNRYLAKGKKVFVSGPVSVTTYTAKDGTTRASLEVTAEDVEFLSPRSDADDTGMEYTPKQANRDKGFVAVDSEEELPF